MFNPLWLLAAAMVIAALGWNLWRHLAADDMQRLNKVRKSSCRLVGTGELVDGSRHVPVAMALSESTLYYENRDMTASLDLDRIEEVEYDNELVTGQNVAKGTVLRLRCVSKVFEFVLDSASVPQWQAALPAVRMAR